MRTLQRLLLIDDNEADNLFHQIIMEEESGFQGEILAFNYAHDALDYLRSNQNAADLILLDINMPRMNGFEFLESYTKFDWDEAEPPVVIMLTTSLNPSDEQKATQYSLVREFMLKPLCAEKFKYIKQTYFSGVA